MLAPPSKIRALLVVGAFWGHLQVGQAQYSGGGVFTPVRLRNPALLADMPYEWIWVGYEPTRFGLPELHWVYVGAALSVGRPWRTMLEVWGRSQRQFTHLHLRSLLGYKVTEFVAVGVTAEAIHLSVPGVSAQWWGIMDVGMAIDGGEEVYGGIVAQNVLPIGWKGEMVPQQVGMGIGWRSEGWGLSIDAVIANYISPTTTLSPTCQRADAETKTPASPRNCLRLRVASGCE